MCQSHSSQGPKRELPFILWSAFIRRKYLQLQFWWCLKWEPPASFSGNAIHCCPWFLQMPSLLPSLKQALPRGSGCGWQGSLGMSLAGSRLRPRLLELGLPLCFNCYSHCHLKTEGRTVAVALHAMAGWDRTASQTASVFSLCWEQARTSNSLPSPSPWCSMRLLSRP